MTDCQLSTGRKPLETLDKIFKNNYLKAVENEQNGVCSIYLKLLNMQTNLS